MPPGSSHPESSDGSSARTESFRPFCGRYECETAAHWSSQTDAAYVLLSIASVEHPALAETGHADHPPGAADSCPYIYIYAGAAGLPAAGSPSAAPAALPYRPP